LEDADAVNEPPQTKARVEARLGDVSRLAKAHDDFRLPLLDNKETSYAQCERGQNRGQG
jgi:hypothetical protein